MRAPQRDLRSEKMVEAAGDRIMGVLGFTTIRFSQARATMQTPGIPDRRYMRPPNAGANFALSYRPPLAIWFEAKRAGGKQSPAQRAFQLMAEACGEDYVVGTEDVLLDWCERKGLIERVGLTFRVKGL